MSIAKYTLSAVMLMAVTLPGIPASATLPRDNSVQQSTATRDNGQLVARRGADDRVGHGRRGRGKDDGQGHNRHGRGSDDAPGDDHGGRRT